MVISFTALTLALGSPLYDKLSESVEREFGEVPELNENVARGLARALRQALALIAVAILGARCSSRPDSCRSSDRLSCRYFRRSLAAGCWGSSWSGALRTTRDAMADRRAAMRVRLRVLGFAVPTFLLAIPFAGVVVFPVATAGGTLLARQLLGEPT